MDAYMINLILTMVLADIIILIVYVISPLVGEAAGFGWRKILWAVIAVRLLIPVHLLQSVLPLPVHTIVLDELVSIHTLTEELEEQKSKAASEDKLQESSLRSPEEQIQYMEPGTVLNPYIESAESLMHGMSSAWFYFIWGTGAVLLLLFRIFQFFGVKKYIHDTSKICKNTYIQEMLVDLCRTYHLKTVPELLINKRISSPMISGYIKPRLILPEDHISIDEIEMILSHELIHYKNKDLWYKLLFMFVCDLFWFNPVLRVMKRAADRDIEYLCDEAVARNISPAGRKAYATMILSGVGKKRERRVAFSTHFIEKESTVEERIENIFTKKSRRKSRIVFVFFLSAIVLSCCFRISIRTVSAYDRGMMIIGNETVSVSGQADGEAAPSHPSEYAVSEISRTAFAGLSETEIKDFHEFITEIHNNWVDLEDPERSDLILSDSGAARWNYFHQTGEIIIGYVYSHRVWGERDSLGLSPRELEAEYGEPVFDQNNYDADGMITKIESFRQKVQDPLFRKDLDRLANAVLNAKDTHAQEYAVEMYQILHDMDYYLFRYGPDYIDSAYDMQEKEKFYGVLEVHKNLMNTTASED